MNLPIVKRDYLLCDLRSKVTDKFQVYIFDINRILLVHKSSVYVMDSWFSQNFYEECLFRFQDMETENFSEVLELWEELAEDMFSFNHVDTHVESF